MADRYHPSYTGGYGYERFERSRDEDREYSRRPVDFYAQHDRHYSERVDSREAFRSASGPDRYEPRYQFRGAAGGQPYRPQDDFSFRSQHAPPAPFFSPAEPERRSAPGPKRSRRNDEPGPRRSGRNEASSARMGSGTRGRGRGRGRGGRSFLPPRPAHMRDILNNTQRDPTPEHFLGGDGDGDGQARFKTEVSSSNEDEEGSGSEVGSETSAADTRRNPAKRRKMQASMGSAAVPLWSNPDPYTVLPPPETLGAPKKDIVQVIRKAKVEAAQNTDRSNDVKENADFISFNFDDESVSDAESDGNHADMPTMSTAYEKSDFANERHFHGSNAMNGDIAVRGMSEDPGPPPPPPDDLLLPTDEEVRTVLTQQSKGKKRKYGGDKKKTGAILDDWEGDGPHSTPWCTLDHSMTTHTSLRMHKEICDFYEFVRPHTHEEQVRLHLISRIQRAVNSFKPGGKSVTIRSFGSFAAGLYLPTGDMDLVANSFTFDNHGPATFCRSNSSLHKLLAHLKASRIAVDDATAVAVTRARVPIVKFIDQETGLKVDISFENDSGLMANETFKIWKEKYPAMPTMVVLIKQLLAMRGLNEVFTGGIGGFTIICLVTSLLQLYPATQAGSLNQLPNYGDLLYQFLELYGNQFDIRTTGIVMQPPQYYNKITHPMPKQNAKRLSIVDPNNPMNDIPGGSSEIDTILDVFREVHAKLQQRLADVQRGINVNDSLLGCVLGGNYQSFLDQRNRLYSLYQYLDQSRPPTLIPAPNNRIPPPPPAVQPRRSSPQVRIPPLTPSQQLTPWASTDRPSKLRKADTEPIENTAASNKHELNVARANALREEYPNAKIPDQVTKKQRKQIVENLSGGPNLERRANKLRETYPNADIPDKVTRAQRKRITENNISQADVQRANDLRRLYPDKDIPNAVTKKGRRRIMDAVQKQGKRGGAEARAVVRDKVSNGGIQKPLASNAAKKKGKKNKNAAKN